MTVGVHDKRPRIVILGAGFGGLYLAIHLMRRLRRARQQAEVILIDRNNYFLFSPLLHEVTVEMVEMHHVVHPVRQFLRKTPVKFLEAGVDGIDLSSRIIRTTRGEVTYDYLVLALGSVTSYFGMETVARFSFPLKTLGEAFRLRNHVISMFEAASATEDAEQRRRMLTFVQVGAGFTGIETITELRDFVYESFARDYAPELVAAARFILVDGLPGLQVPTNPKLAQYVLRLLRGKGIDVHFKTQVKDAGLGWVEFADGERIATNTLIWTAGVMANPVIAALRVEQGPLKRLKVRDTLQLLEYPEVLALGDCACFLDNEGKPLPMTAQVANQQAPVGADNLVRMLTEKPLRLFRYRRLGELASLGTYNAIADLGKVQLRGILAWWIWRSIYLVKMPWWADRFRIAADWTLDLFFPRDTSRIEVGPCPECPLHGGCPGAQGVRDSEIPPSVG